MSTPLAPVVGAAPGVQAVVLTKEQKAAGVTPEAVAAQLAAQTLQATAPAQDALSAMGSRGVHVRMVPSPHHAAIAQGLTAPALQTTIIEPPAVQQPPQAEQHAPEAHGVLDLAGASLEGELAVLDDAERVQLAAQLAERRHERQRQEQARSQAEQLEQHEVRKHVEAFAPAGGQPTVQRLYVQVSAIGGNASRAIQGSQPLVLELRGPIEVQLKAEEPVPHAEAVEAQSPTPKRDETGKKDPGLDVEETQHEAERQEQEAGDNADSVPDNGRPISVGRQDEGEDTHK